MGCVKLHILDEQYKSTELRVSYFNKELTLNNSAVKTYRYSFTGYERDQESGLDYAHARYYWSNGGYDISTDPHWFNYPHITPYNYAGNNPIRFIDPTGMDNYEISTNQDGKAQINVERTEDKTNTYTYINADGTKKDLGTYDKKNNMVKLAQKTDFYTQVEYSNKKNYVDGDVAAGFLAGMYYYNQETGNIAQITQLNNSNGGHSSHGGRGTNADVRYANLNGSDRNEPVWTSGSNFDKANSQKLADAFVKFGFNRPNGKFSILTENAAGNGPALDNTNFVDGKGKFHHKHHMHLQQFNTSIINVIKK